MRESQIENAVCRHARNYQWWPLKLKIVNHLGFPDRMLLGAGGRVVFIEFKAPRKKSRPSQRLVISKLKSMGFEVYVVDDIEKGKRLVERLVAQLPEAGS